MRIQDIQFSSEFNIEGMWWIPEDQNNKIKGILSYSLKEGIILKTFSHFKSNRIPLESELEVIYGTLIYLAYKFLYLNVMEGLISFILDEDNVAPHSGLGMKSPLEYRKLAH